MPNWPTLTVSVYGAGGYYPDDEFYDLCDELGLIVWEDFMFACSVYELTPEFEANITQEFIDNIKRLRHHASLGLWCGNNEMESFVKDGEWVSKPSEVRDYLFMYERIIPQVLKKYDPGNLLLAIKPFLRRLFRGTTGSEPGRCAFLAGMAWKQAVFRVPEIFLPLSL